MQGFGIVLVWSRTGIGVLWDLGAVLGFGLWGGVRDCLAPALGVAVAGAAVDPLRLRGVPGAVAPRLRFCVFEFPLECVHAVEAGVGEGELLVISRSVAPSSSPMDERAKPTPA